MKKIMLILAALFSFSMLFSAVEFIEFNAGIQDMNVLLSWSTASETENVGFILERKTDSLSAWDPLISYLHNDELLGQGTVSSQTDYAYIDSILIPGEYYYRLSGVDEGSAIGLLDSLSINIPETSIETSIPDEFRIQCYPNPFNPSVTIHYQLPVDSHIKASVYTSRGQLLDQLLNSRIPAGSHELIWNANENPSGIYILKIYSGDIIATQKLILIK